MVIKISKQESGDRKLNAVVESRRSSIRKRLIYSLAMKQLPTTNKVSAVHQETILKLLQKKERGKLHLNSKRNLTFKFREAEEELWTQEQKLYIMKKKNKNG